MLSRLCGGFSRLGLASSEIRLLSTTVTEAESLSGGQGSKHLENEATEERSEKELVDCRRSLWRAPISPFTPVPQAWVSTVESIPDKKVGLIDLHPDVFRTTPRFDILHRNIVWQQVYRNVQLTKMLTRAEMPGGGRKPWPQKKTGRAHVGSLRSPEMIRGGFAHGARGPRTWFYMLPDSIRIKGLCVALTTKLAQDDLHIVNSFDSFPDDADAHFLMDMAEERNWGYSVLFVTEHDQISGALAEAVSQLPSFTVMPYYGLNCYSMLKHDTLVMTRKAVDLVEGRILENLHRSKTLNNKFRYKDMKETILNEAEGEEHPVHAPFV